MQCSQMDTFLTVSNKADISHSLWLNNSTPRLIASRNASICSPKNDLRMFWAVLFVTAKSLGKTPQIPTNSRTSNYIMILLCCGILYSSEKEQIIVTECMNLTEIVLG